MPKMIARHRVIVVRDGARVTVDPNKVFEFTSKEIRELGEHSPDLLRSPKNETPDAFELDEETEAANEAAAAQARQKAIDDAKAETERLAKEAEAGASGGLSTEPPTEPVGSTAGSSKGKVTLKPAAAPGGSADGL